MAADHRRAALRPHALLVKPAPAPPLQARHFRAGRTPACELRSLGVSLSAPLASRMETIEWNETIMPGEG
jgi:hypothetical protein